MKALIISILALFVVLNIQGCHSPTATAQELNNSISYTLYGNDSAAIVNIAKNKDQILSLLNPLLPWSDDFNISKNDTLEFEVICILPQNVYSEFKLNGKIINPLKKYWIDEKGIHKKYVVTL